MHKNKARVYIFLMRPENVGELKVFGFRIDIMILKCYIVKKEVKTKNKL